MKNIKTLLSTALLILVFAGCGTSNKEDKKVIIGVILPLTGEVASYGTDLKKGLELGLGLDTSRIVLIYEDSKADPKLAVTAANKLISIDKVDLILGPFTSSEVLAVAPIAEKNKITLITPTASSPSITDAGDYIFRITPSDNFDGEIMSNFLYTNLKINNASVLYVNNDYGLGVSKIFEQNFKKLGGTITDSYSYDPNLKDYRSVLIKIKNSNSNSVFLVGMKEMGTIIKQMGELNIKSQILSIGLIEDPDILITAGAFSNGIYYSFPSYNSENTDSLTVRFVADFVKMSGTKPSILTAYGYDLGMLVSQLISNKGKRDNFQALLYNTKQFKGVTGIMDFDSNGDVKKTFGIKKINDGNFIWEIKNY